MASIPRADTGRSMALEHRWHMIVTPATSRLHSLLVWRFVRWTDRTHLGGRRRGGEGAGAGSRSGRTRWVRCRHFLRSPSELTGSTKCSASIRTERPCPQFGKRSRKLDVRPELQRGDRGSFSLPVSRQRRDVGRALHPGVNHSTELRVDAGPPATARLPRRAGGFHAVRSPLAAAGLLASLHRLQNPTTRAAAVLTAPGRRGGSFRHW
jgi:hypothetical protein